MDELQAWGEVRRHERLSGGTRNIVWRAEVDGDACLVRVGRRSGAALEWELNLLEWLCDRGVAVPRVLRTTDGSRCSGSTVLFSWIEGEPPKGREEWVRVRDYLERLHSITEQWDQRPGFVAAAELSVRRSGGDVDLSLLPGPAVELCLAAWARVPSQRAVVHGDPGRSNILMGDDGPVLVDWDEARVDCPWFDLTALPEALVPLHGYERWAAQQASAAWEAAVSWRIEPEYAQRRLAELEQGEGRGAP